MIDGALPYLRCPVCEQALSRIDRALRCAAGHGFDLARQGYANLSNGRVPYSGDTAEMVADRDRFLASGHYAFIAGALASYATGDGLVVDAGTGTGYYLARVLEAAEIKRDEAVEKKRDEGTGKKGEDAGESVGLGLDVSKAALRRAARSHPRAAAVLADLWGPLPIRDGAAALLLDVFAPRNGPEFHRVLRPDGVLLVVTPAPDHLTELIEAHALLHVDPDKATRVAESLGDHFTAVESRVLRRRLELTGPEVRTLIGMTPNAHHVPAGTRPDEPGTVTAAVTITAYRKRA
jgi:23S rRNA (guanine745-N1)-methyltransferase